MEVALDPKATSTEMKFFVEGVRCAKCVHKLESLNSEHNEISESRFDKSKSLLTLNTQSLLTPHQAVQWIEAKGYKAYFVETSKQTEDRQNQAQRRWLIRLAVTFFFASNLMMFAIAIYMGAYGDWNTLFSWICGLLFLPIAFYSAVPFYQSAWQSVKERRFSADLAIVIAFGWGSLLSYFNLFRGNTDFYFDSTASFLFLILLARYFLDRAQNSIESNLNPSLLFKTSPVFDIRRSGEKLTCYYHQILREDHLTLHRGQTLPVDILLESDVAEIDTSLFSGESLPQTFHRGALIKAGMIGLSSTIEGKSVGSFQDSELHAIFEGVVRNRHEKTRAHAQAEIYSQRLLTTVALVSAAIFIYFGVQEQWAEGFRRSLALFTIACPCALALAIPLASVMTLKRAMERGLFVKTPLFFEKLLSVRGVIFDKTGTLTQGQMDFCGWDIETPPPHILRLLLAMEQRSHHPIAQSLTRLLQEQKVEPVNLDSWKETPGVGIEASFEGLTYQITRINNPSHKNLTGFQLISADRVLVTAYFKDQIRPEAKGLIQRLRQDNREIHLLSGDRPEVVANIAQELGLSAEETHSPLNPQEKAAFVEKAQSEGLQTYLMVGDGHNDALALSKASVSLAVKGCAETSLRAADAYSKKNDLQILLTAFQLSHFYHRLVRQNVGLSLTYNVIAGSMAILGLVDPLMAAVLMPLNSLVVIGATVLARPRKMKEQ